MIQQNSLELELMKLAKALNEGKDPDEASDYHNDLCPNCECELPAFVEECPTCNPGYSMIMRMQRNHGTPYH